MSNTDLMRWRDMSAELVLYFPECPGPVIEQMLRQAAIEFCTAAPVWVCDLDPVFTVDGLTSYEIDTPEGAEIAQIQALDTKGAGFNDWTFNRPNLLTLGYSLPGGALIDVRASLAPSASADGMPAWIDGQYGEAIRHGARARLMMMPGQSWTQPQMAAVHRRYFTEAVGNARVAVARSHGRRDLFVQPRRFV